MPPSIHQCRKLVLGKAHLDSTHRFKGTGGAAIAEGKLCDFTFLTQVSIDPVLFHGNLEHLAGAGAVNVTTLCKDLLPPSFVCKPCDNPRFDGRKVRNQKLRTFTWDKGRADELG